MQLIHQLRCLLRGHSFGSIESNSFWFSTTCKCCGETLTGDAVLELAMFMPSTSMQFEAATTSFAATELSKTPTANAV